MIDALPPEDAGADPARAGRALCLRGAARASRTPRAATASADERQAVSDLNSLTLARSARRAEEEILLGASNWPTRISRRSKRRARSMPMCWRRRSAPRAMAKAVRRAHRGGQSRAAGRHSARHQGHVLHRRRALDGVLAHPRQFRADLRLDRDRQSVARRRGAARQDQQRRVRHGLVERDLAFRPGDLAVAAQGRQHAAGAGRLVGRLGGGGGGAIVPGRHRHRHRRLDPPAGGLHRHGRHQADLWALLALGHRGLCVLARPGRAVRAHGARRRDPAALDGRARRQGHHLRRSAGAGLRGRGRQVGEGPAHRHPEGIPARRHAGGDRENLAAGQGVAEGGGRRAGRGVAAAHQICAARLLHRRDGGGLVQSRAL